MKFYLTTLLIFNSFLFAQNNQFTSKVWVADNGDGTYKNPIIHADYSDPDVVRVGSDYYMISSSFNQSPGIPILHSTDLVNWKLIGHALQKLVPENHFSKVQHGGGVWAPSIRFHKGEFYIYYPDPDFGIYLIKSKNILGPWSEPFLVETGKGLIDPCPLWDDDGRVYLVHAFAGSRAGFKSIIVVKEMNKAGTKTIDAGVMVYDGHQNDPTIEGPKFHKRNGYYYIFAPAGGVSTGWQIVLRSKNVYGTYDRKIVMNQGSSTINGPHQGAWINTTSGEDWFIHFQDKNAYGRVIHLQPMRWKNDWPIIGIDNNNDAIGEPVLVYKKPNIISETKEFKPQESDEFNAPKLGLQWQWQANTQSGWAFPTSNGCLRMFSVYNSDSINNLWNLPNILTQKLPAEAFTATAKVNFSPKFNNEIFGLVMFGLDYAYVAIEKRENGLFFCYRENFNADKNKKEVEIDTHLISGHTFYLQIKMLKDGICYFGFGENENNIIQVSKSFTAKQGKWVGAKLGMFCNRKNITNDAGYVDVDWFKIEK